MDKLRHIHPSSDKNHKSPIPQVGKLPSIWGLGTSFRRLDLGSWLIRLLDDLLKNIMISINYLGKQLKEGGLPILAGYLLY